MRFYTIFLAIQPEKGFLLLLRNILDIAAKYTEKKLQAKVPSYFTVLL
jgi:hypothetical protein